MLHDAIELDPVVDAEAALEFLKEATKLATATELEDVGERLEAKHRLFAELLGGGAVGGLDEAGLKRLTVSIFSLKRKGGRLVNANGAEKLAAELEALLHGPGAVAARFDRFCGAVKGVEEAMRIALASEALHFTFPDRYWLWTHWLWNPGARTGALALVTRDDVDLAGDTPGAVYEKVGRAMAYVNRRGHEVGFSRSGRGLFGTDVFLACVYAVYMYTVFRMKLSQEFNRILPELPELVERVLGVHQPGRARRARQAAAQGAAAGEAGGAG